MQPPPNSVNFFNIEYLFYVIYMLFSGQASGALSGSLDGGGYVPSPELQHIAQLWFEWEIFIGIFCLILIGFMAYWGYRIYETRVYEDEVLYAPIVLAQPEQIASERWQHIMTMADSPNPSDWKQAIIEADIMLDELMAKAGYTGATLGDKLKQVATGDFPRVQEAWEAHKVRNQIAHEADFILTKREAQAALHNYRVVFEELNIS